MGSDVGQIFPTASLHRDHSILYALVCEKKKNPSRGSPIVITRLADGDREGRIFQLGLYPNTNNGLFFLLTIKYRIFILKKNLSKVSVTQYAEMRHYTIID